MTAVEWTWPHGGPAGRGVADTIDLRRGESPETVMGPGDGVRGARRTCRAGDVALPMLAYGSNGRPPSGPYLSRFLNFLQQSARGRSAAWSGMAPQATAQDGGSPGSPDGLPPLADELTGRSRYCQERKRQRGCCIDALDITAPGTTAMLSDGPRGLQTHIVQTAAACPSRCRVVPGISGGAGVSPGADHVSDSRGLCLPCSAAPEVCHVRSYIMRPGWLDRRPHRWLSRDR